VLRRKIVEFVEYGAFGLSLSRSDVIACRSSSQRWNIAVARSSNLFRKLPHPVDLAKAERRVATCHASLI
jgi:hypothetical protein